MKNPIIIIGIGELAGVFALGFLRCGYPVYPITRNMDMTEECQKIPSPELVLVTVQEDELHSILDQLPEPWRHKVGLVQNELLPRDWLNHNINNPTVTVVWFEKKQNLELTNILQSPSYGPNSSTISKALLAVHVPAPILKSEQDLLFELVRKALYILTVNIAGLLDNCTVGDLWLKHQSLAREIASEVIQIQQHITKVTLPQEKLIKGMVEGIKDCPDRYCLGRRAFSRLQRILSYAEKNNIKTPKLIEIYNIAKQE
ncbi:MAG: hypothetical protein ACKE51_04820 [Methylococcaceae bacterium]